MPKSDPIDLDLAFLAEQQFPGIDGKQVMRHGQLVSLWHDCTARELIADLGILTQILAFKQYREQHDAEVLAAARDAHWAGGTHDCGEWLKDGACQLCGVRPNPS